MQAARLVLFSVYTCRGPAARVYVEGKGYSFVTCDTVVARPAARLYSVHSTKQIKRASDTLVGVLLCAKIIRITSSGYMFLC